MWSPETHSPSLNGPVPFIVVAALGLSVGLLVQDAQIQNRIERARSRHLGRQDHGVFVGVSMVLQYDAPGPTVARFNVFGSWRLQQRVLDVVAGQLAAVVVLHALAQVELESACCPG